jgi:uncharacterized delta-60 repeat protein
MVTLQPDDKILVNGGYAPTLRAQGFLRYNATGRLDPSFGHDGTAVTTIGTGAVAVEPDRKIVVVGSVGGKGRGEGNFTDFALARYTPDGHLDPSFGRRGKVVTNFADSEGLDAVAIQGDGKIVVAGSVSNYSPSVHEAAVARYIRDGRLDRRFGTRGLALTGPRSYTAWNAVAIRSDGTIVTAGLAAPPFVGGHQRYRFALARYTHDGRLETGTVTRLEPDFEPGSLAFEADGKIILAGSIKRGTRYEFALHRYLPNGSPDPGFGSSGSVRTDFGRYPLALASAVAIQPGGRIVVAGGVSPRSQEHSLFALARYTAEGKLDATFGTGGKVVTNLGSKICGANSVAIQHDGKIVAGGCSGLARYKPDGHLDSG